MVTPTKASLKSRAKKMGLHVSGDFIIANCGDDIISGIAMDYAPHHAYLWEFALPKFDSLPFLHMTIGRRLPVSLDSVNSIDIAIDSIKNKIINIRNANELINYIDDNRMNSEYANWAKYLCFIRTSDFYNAECVGRYFDSHPLSKSIHEKFQKLGRVRTDGGWEAVQRLLDDWAAQAEARYCHA